MVDVVKDERKVEITGENKVTFSYDNVQDYTKEQARNVYVSMLYEIKEKEKYLEKFEQLQKDGNEALDRQLSSMMDKIKKSNPKVDMVKLKHWKEIQLIQNQSQLAQQFKKVKDDIKSLREGLKIWDCCKDLPKTKHEEKLEEQFKDE